MMSTPYCIVNPISLEVRGLSRSNLDMHTMVDRTSPNETSPTGLPVAYVQNIEHCVSIYGTSRPSHIRSRSSFTDSTSHHDDNDDIVEQDIKKLNPRRQSPPIQDDMDGDNSDDDQSTLHGGPDDDTQIDEATNQLALDHQRSLLTYSQQPNSGSFASTSAAQVSDWLARFHNDNNNNNTNVNEQTPHFVATVSSSTASLSSEDDEESLGDNESASDLEGSCHDNSHRVRCVSHRKQPQRECEDSSSDKTGSESDDSEESGEDKEDASVNSEWAATLTGNTTDRTSLSSSDWGDDICEFDRQESRRVRQMFDEIERMLFDSHLTVTAIHPSGQTLSNHPSAAYPRPHHKATSHLTSMDISVCQSPTAGGTLLAPASSAEVSSTRYHPMQSHQPPNHSHHHRPAPDPSQNVNPPVQNVIGPPSGSFRRPPPGQHLHHECRHWLDRFPHFRLLGLQILPTQDVGFALYQSPLTSVSSSTITPTPHDPSVSSNTASQTRRLSPTTSKQFLQHPASRGALEDSTTPRRRESQSTQPGAWRGDLISRSPRSIESPRSSLGTTAEESLSLVGRHVDFSSSSHSISRLDSLNEMTTPELPISSTSGFVSSPSTDPPSSQASNILCPGAEEILEIEGEFQEIIAVDFKLPEEDSGEGKVLRHRPRGYPPLTPNAVLRDTIASNLFDAQWSDVVSWSRPLVREILQKALHDQVKSVDVLPMDDDQDAPLDPSASMGPLVFTHRIPKNAVYGPAGDPSGMLSDILHISSKTLQQRERSIIQDNMSDCLLLNSTSTSLLPTTSSSPTPPLHNPSSHSMGDIPTNPSTPHHHPPISQSANVITSAIRQSSATSSSHRVQQLQQRPSSGVTIMHSRVSSLPVQPTPPPSFGRPVSRPGSVKTSRESSTVGMTRVPSATSRRGGVALTVTSNRAGRLLPLDQQRNTNNSIRSTPDHSMAPKSSAISVERLTVSPAFDSTSTSIAVVGSINPPHHLPFQYRANTSGPGLGLLRGRSLQPQISAQYYSNANANQHPSTPSLSPVDVVLACKLASLPPLSSSAPYAVVTGGGGRPGGRVGSAVPQYHRPHHAAHQTHSHQYGHPSHVYPSASGAILSHSVTPECGNRPSTTQGFRSDSSMARRSSTPLGLRSGSVLLNLGIHGSSIGNQAGHPVEERESRPEMHHRKQSVAGSGNWGLYPNSHSINNAFRRGKAPNSFIR